MASLSDARQAKAAVIQMLGDNDAVNGVGIIRTDDSYAVKVNLLRSPGSDLAIPDSINGVPVTWEVVGVVRKQRIR